MARILLGWELGAGRGHALLLGACAARLKADGHQVAIAAPPGRSGDTGTARWIAAPELIRLRPDHAPLRPRAAPSSHAGILAAAGFDDPALILEMVQAWERLIAAERPQLIVAEHAPFLLAAARGRVPILAIGTGFTLPPAHLPRFPALAAGADDADAILRTTNRALAQAGRPPLERLPQLFAAERHLVGCYAELDPYRAHRLAPNAPPHVGADLPPLAAGAGETVFVSVAAPPRAPLWEALELSGLPVRVFLPGAGAAFRAALARRGFRVEAAPVPFAEIARDARLVLTHGGAGFVSSSLLAGLPQIVCHYDLEKALTAAALTALGAAGEVARDAIDPAAMAASLRRAHADEGLAARARALAPTFRARHAGGAFVDGVASAAADLA
jgi:rhamnosyltransferase subunit B